MSPAMQILIAAAAISSYGIGIGITAACMDSFSFDHDWPWCVLWPATLTVLVLFIALAGPGILMYRLVKGRWPE